MFETTSDLEQSELRNVINQLLAVNFLVKELDKKGYYMARKHKKNLELFFGFLGWEFVLDDRHEIIFVSSSKGQHIRRLNKEESIWFLVLRILYQEKREGLSLANHPAVTLYEIKAKYETFRLPPFPKSKATDYIKLCSQYQLLKPIDSDWHSDDSRYQLFHSWLYVIEGDAVEQMSRKIRRYEIEEEQGDEMAEETETR